MSRENTTTCWDCHQDFPDNEMINRPDGEGEWCPKCAAKHQDELDAAERGDKKESLKRELLRESTCISPYIKPIQAFTWRVGEKDGNRSELAQLTGAFVPEHPMKWNGDRWVEEAMGKRGGESAPEMKTNFSKGMCNATRSGNGIVKGGSRMTYGNCGEKATTVDQFGNQVCAAHKNYYESDKKEALMRELLGEDEKCQCSERGCHGGKPDPENRKAPSTCGKPAKELPFGQMGMALCDKCKKKNEDGRPRCPECKHPMPVHHADGCHYGDGCKCKRGGESQKESTDAEKCKYGCSCGDCDPTNILCKCHGRCVLEGKKESLKRELMGEAGTIYAQGGPGKISKTDLCTTCDHPEHGLTCRQCGYNQLCNDERIVNAKNLTAKKKESKEKPMKTKPVGEQFHAVANAAINMMVRIQESPRAGRVTPLLARLDKVANKAADAVAARMMGEENPGYEFPALFKELQEIHSKIKASIGEGWHMFPALGLGNDFSMESSGGAWEPAEDKGTGTGLPSLPDVAAAFSNTGGTDLGKAESVNKYVDSLLNEKKCKECGEAKCECKG